MEKTGVKEYFEQEKKNVLKLYTIKLIASIVLMVSLCALLFIPFVKYDAFKSYSDQNNLSLTSSQIDDMKDLFDTEQRNFEKAVNELKKELTKKEYAMLEIDIKRDAFIGELSTFDWEEVREILESNLEEDKKPYVLNEDEKKELVELYIVSDSTYSLFNLFSNDKYSLYTKDGLGASGESGDTASIFASSFFLSFRMVGGIFSYVALAVVAVAAILTVIKFIKKKDQDLMMYFDDNIINKPKNTKFNRMPVSFATGTVVFGIGVSILAALANQYGYGVSWTIAFVVIFLALFIASLAYPAMFAKGMRDRIRKQKYGIE